MTDAALTELGHRIEVLTVDPEAISSPFTRFVRPLLFRIGWRPSVSAEETTRLVRMLGGDGDAEDLPDQLARAIRELGQNVGQVERASVITQRTLTSHAAWLRRTFEVVVAARRAMHERDVGPEEVTWSSDEAALLPPLSLIGVSLEEAELGDEPGARAGPDPTRVLDIQLDAVDHILALSREETRRLGRRRRLLEAARQLLLETSAALPLDPDAVAQRAQHIARGITRINRLEAVGLRRNVDLLHQARTALSRDERDRLWASLQAMRVVANEASDGATTHLAQRALDALEARASSDTSVDSLARSGSEVMGERVLRAIERGYESARAARDRDAEARASSLSELLKEYLAPGAERETLAHALAVDGCFEVGGALSPVRIEEVVIRREEVAFPTSEMVLVPARGPEDLPTSVLGDPRTVLLDLAAGRLLNRRFIREQPTTRSRVEMQGELRIYLLDGSESMIGPRARMRDATLIAELATLIQRLERPRPATKVALFFRYFTHVLGPVTEVRAVDEALEAISRVLATPRSGGTDIEGALLASLERVRVARAEDPELARAQIVLITDGEAAVSAPAVDAALAKIEDVVIGVSVIALGQENVALRRLVARQRRRGVRAFYHYLPDDHLEALSAGRVDEGVRVHVPPVRARTASELQAELGPMLEDLARLERARDSSALASLGEADLERRIGGAAEQGVDGEGSRARVESRFDDAASIVRRFHRWFPPFGGQRRETSPPPAPGTPERDDLESVLVLLSAIVEVLELSGDTPHARQADAVDLLERLLPNARLSPARYHDVLRLHPAEVAEPIAAVHAASERGVMWQLGRPEPTPAR